MVLFLSAVAYFSAIGLKAVVQVLTYGWVESTFGTASLPTGLYFGLQTCFLEVGLAYAVAKVAVSRGKIEARDGEGYGISLAFWENGILLGALSVFSLVITYFLIADGLLSQSLYQTIVNAEPSAFLPPAQIIIPSAFGILERISSLLLHFSWGYLCVLAAYLGRRRYFLAALPMGLVDTLVPFASEVPVWVFESALFLISLGALAAAWRVTETARRSGYAKALTPAAAPGSS